MRLAASATPRLRKVGGDALGCGRPWRHPVQHGDRRPPLVARHRQGRLGRPQIERRGLDRDQHQPRGAHRDARLGLDVRRAVDDDEIGLSGAIGDPLLGAPAGHRRELKADRRVPEPLPSQPHPGGEAGLRVDVEHGDLRTLPRPGDRQLRGQGRLAGPALALRYRDHPSRHQPQL